MAMTFFKLGRLVRAICVFLFVCLVVQYSSADRIKPVSASPKDQQSSMPKSFAYLSDVDETIVQDMRYFGSHNFLGRKVVGYEAGECILTLRAARALSKVQSRLLKRDLSLKVYDCYRPQRAVNDFIGWSKKGSDTKTKAEFYPTLKKSTLFRSGYIARRSGHSRGSTVDLTIIALPPKDQPQFSIDKQMACFLEQTARYLDNSLDFGTGYDCFHQKSHTRSPLIGEVARKNRALLLSEMAKAGFENYSKEWWHFSLKDEPFVKTYFDFPIRAKVAKKINSIEDLIKETAPPLNEVVGDKGEISIDSKTEDSITEGEKLGADEEREKQKDMSDVVSTLDLIEVDEALRVVCVALDDVLNVRSLPLNKAIALKIIKGGQSGEKNNKPEIVAAIPSDGVGIVTRGCTGEIDLASWHGLSLKQRRAVGVPWCQVVSYKMSDGGEDVEAVGWVSGSYLAGSFQHRQCPK